MSSTGGIRRELQKDPVCPRKKGKKISGNKIKEERGEKTIRKEIRIQTLRKGRPRLVTFIIWDVAAGGAVRTSWAGIADGTAGRREGRERGEGEGNTETTGHRDQIGR